MRRSTQRILTTHVGSLPRPDDLVALNAESVRALTRSEAIDQDPREARLRTAVTEVAERQREIGLDVVNDGEFGKATSGSIDYGAWQSYAYERLTGWDAHPSAQALQRTDVDRGRAVPHGIAERRERHLAEFEDFYRELAKTTPTSLRLTFTGPISYRGHALIERDIANLQQAVGASGAAEAFMTAVAPGSFARGMNRYYGTHEEFLYAVAEAMRTEYQAIVKAGFILQVDDPGFAESWDAMDPSISLDEYRAYVVTAVEALNHALAGLPEDRIRYHLCWGSWHGPHVTDLPLRDVVDLLLRVRAGAYSLEAANPRHEHEWKVWRDAKLPEGKVLIPGVVTHSTNIVEHPEMVADRIVRYAEVVGKENLIAGTDCGLGARIHPSLAWAKLRALVEGAALASGQLWGPRGGAE
jgi:5-methyltetrahydropteroyltriglutamate--homocysteine methyltransferase